jgi:exodeoxyribonuclease V gamma subunit
MLHLHTSNRPETLAAMLLQRLVVPRGDPFATEPVIVPNAAHRRALALALADATGICANQPFGYLALWLWQQAARVLPQVGATSPFDAPVLVWRIWRAFDDPAFVAAAPRLAAYLRTADPRMRLELAQRTAALFDRYLTYRADWLQHWAAGRGAPELGGAAVDEAWQAALWRRLAAEVQMPARHPRQAFAEALARDGEGLLQAGVLPARVHVFALPAIAPLHLQMLLPLAAVTELHLYAWNPCAEFWFELVAEKRRLQRAARGRADAGDAAETGHRLLAGWGRQTQAQLAALGAIDHVPVQHDEHFAPAAAPTLLGALQDSVLQLQEPARGAWAAHANDRSIELHVCHSLARELEVLHDRLLALFAGDAGLRPEDILVVTPDLARAAPLIEAQFGTAPAARRIDVSLAGRRPAAANAPARVLLALLELASSRCTATDLVALLGEPLVAARFGLDAAALEAVRGWLPEAGFRWAIDDEQVRALGLPVGGAHTLRDALARLFLGHVLPDAVDQPFRQLLPAGAAAGSEALALGALWAFAERLDELRQALARPLAPADWAALLDRALDDFVQAAADALDERQELEAAIAELVRQITAAGQAEPLPAAVLRDALAAALDDPRPGGAPGGGVVFGSFATLRGLPCRVLCAIGMDDGAFPAQRRPDEFDLLAQRPRPGDREPRDDDRAAWLERVLAPSDRLLISHTGRSITDDSPRPPSVLVDELLDWLADACTPADADAAVRARVRRGFVVAHPLQPFAAEAFRTDGDERRRSFDAELADALRANLAAASVPAAADAPAHAADADADADAAADADDETAEATDADDARAEPLPPFFTAALPAPGPEWREVTLEQLRRFFRNPCRALLGRRLRIDLPRPDETLADDEVLAPEARAGYALAERLLPALLRGVDGDALRVLARAGGEAPAGTLGDDWLDRQLARLQLFAARVRAAAAEPALPPAEPRLPVEVDGETWHLRAALPGLRPSGWVGWRFAQASGADRLDAWLHHLVLCAATPAGAAPRTTWIGEPEGFALRPCGDAPAQLARLLRLYARGLRAPLHFYPKAAWAYVDGGGSLDSARAAWTPTEFRPYAEGADPAYRLALRGVTDPLDAVFEALAYEVFEPLRAHLVEDGS